MKSVVFIFLSLFGVALFGADDGEKIFDEKCMMCHVKGMPQDMSNLVAPPVNGVMRHVKMDYQSRGAAVAFISDYVINPTKQKAVCKSQKIQRFGLMPSQKGNITKEELQIVANWLFDNYPAKGFKGRGNGRGNGRGGRSFR